LDRFEEDHAEVPALWHLELANALAVGERHKRIMPARSSEFIALIGGLPIVIDEQTPSLALGTVLDLARKEGLSETQALARVAGAKGALAAPRRLTGGSYRAVAPVVLRAYGSR
jgi:hypothetical protein